ncbi:MAG: hydrogenase expression/formation protein HypE [Cellulosilyticaceae bacterium]
MMIKMAHGSGGKETAVLVSELFEKYFHNQILGQHGDAALFELGGRLAMTTDSFVVTPLTFPGGDIGRLAVCGTLNDLLMEGAVPKYITAGFILEEGLSLSLLEEVVQSMAQELARVGVLLIAGDTKVIEGQGGMYINTTGIGVIPQDNHLVKGIYEAGDVVLVSGTLGDHHSCILSSRMGICNNIISDVQSLAAIVTALQAACIPIKAMRDITRGGLGTVLNEVMADSGYGAIIQEEALPVNEEVRGLCDILGLDPLYMGNEGKMLLIVPKDYGEQALTCMKHTKEGKAGAIIGSVTKEKGILLRTPFGGRRYVDVLYGEGLPRIC